MPRAQKPAFAPFRLLHLPLVAIDDIVKCLNPIEVLDLSAVSRRSSVMLNLLRPRHQVKMHINFGWMTTLKLFNSHGDEVHVFEWKIDKGTLKQVSSRRKDIVQIANVSNSRNQASNVSTRRKVSTRPQSLLTYETNTPRLSEISSNVNAALKHIFFIFPFIQVENLTLEYGTEKSLKLIIALPSETTVENLIVKSRCVNENVRYLLENISVRNSFKCEATECGGTQIKDKLQCAKRISIENSIWMDSSKLLQLNCEIVKLSKTRISTDDFEEFLRDWMTSPSEKYNNLRYLELELLSDGNVVNFEDLGATRWDHTRRNWKYQFENGKACDLSGALDIEREDGTIGSIIMKGRNLRTQFYVWPNKPQ